jgi:SAM-dependent methyltransferase
MRDFYDWLARELGDGVCPFLNYGYIGPGGRKPGVDGLHTKLLEKVLAGVMLTGRRVLEVGSGRGGNCAWISHNCRPEMMAGVDRCLPNVMSSRSRARGAANTAFTCSDAQLLPFADSSFDVVLNLESSHCYADLPAFLNEVSRVLRPGGFFCWADLWGLEVLGFDWRARERAFVALDLTLVARADLTEGVFLALKDRSSLPNRLRANISSKGREVLDPFVRNINTIRLHLAAGQCEYRMMQFEKLRGGPHE